MENPMLKAAEPLNQKDLEDFQDFRTEWRNGTLKNDHVVMVKVKRWAKRIAYKFDKPQRADDLEQSCLISLANCDYQGKAKLDTFIVKILLHENTAEWRRSGSQRQDEFPDEIGDLASQELMAAVLARISSDRLMANLLKTRPDLKRTIVLIIARAEHHIGRKRIAELASEQLGRKVTRYEVEVALEQLRDNLEDAGYHKATAGLGS